MMLKKIAMGVAVVGAFGIASSAFADQNLTPPSDNGSGFYVTGNLGYNFVGSDKKTEDGAIFKNTKSDGVAGGGAVGYNFDKYFAVQAGFNLFHDVDRQATGTAVISGQNVSVTTKQAISLYDLNLLGKATIPFNRFFAFVDGGMAYVHAKYKAASISVSNLGTASNIGDSHSKGFIRPQIGAGVGYNLTNNLAVDVDYQHVFGANKITDKNYLPGLNTVELGLSYKFAM